MDPLSIIASVTGILAVAAKITTAVTGFVQKERDAPASAHSVLSELSELTCCLAGLRPFIHGTAQAERSRRDAISVEQIVVVSTSLVLRISELDKLVESFSLTSVSGRIQWVRHGEKVESLLDQIRALKGSLSLILTIFTWSVLHILVTQGLPATKADSVVYLERLLPSQSKTSQWLSSVSSKAARMSRDD